MYEIGPDYMNEALRAARVEGIRMGKTAQGGLLLETGEMSYDEVVDRLVTGITWLYAQLVRARAS